MTETDDSRNDDSRNDDSRDDDVPGQDLAIGAEVLYLINLLALPFFGFLGLLVLYVRFRRTAPPLARCHLAQTLSASLWGAVLLLAVNALILLLGGYTAPSTWVVLVLYFSTCHSTLVILGVIGLAKAMAGQLYRYPLIGRDCI
ncbi:MAG: hypothetical protein HY941_03375 [Gammaproteobacteria bacterium]|nr:hypothetical protein [Gammaproteobacteria bacterium]